MSGVLLLKCSKKLPCVMLMIVCDSSESPICLQIEFDKSG